MIAICPKCSHVFESNEVKNKLSLDEAYDIIDTCCDYFEVNRNAIFSNTKRAKVVKARHIAMFLIYSEGKNGVSSSQVSRMFFRHHTSVIHARERCKDALSTKGDVYEDLLRLSQKISGNHLKIAV